MNDINQSNPLKINSYPILLWLIGFGLLAFDAFIFVQGGLRLEFLIIAIPGLLFLLLPNAIFITVDRNTGLLTIAKHGVITHKTIEIPIYEVANAEVESTISRNHHDGHTTTSTSYRIVIVKTNGEKVPVTNVFSGGYRDKAVKAKKICQYLNLPGWEDKATNIFQMALQQQANLTMQPVAAAPGVPAGAPVRDSAGITWRTEQRTVGSVPVTRWVTNDFTLPGQFLLISQKAAGGPGFGDGKGGGFFAGLATMIYQQIVTMYGFQPSDTPGMSEASSVGAVDATFDQHFATLSNSPASTRSLITPWVIRPLVNWALHHPLKSVQKQGEMGQIVVLFSPKATYVAVLGGLGVEEMSEIGGIAREVVHSVQ